MSYFFSLVNIAAIYGSLAALQVLLLNRLGLAFAAIPIFAGLGAYAIAASVLGYSVSLGLVALTGLLAVGISFLSNHLPRDLYLLCTLAALECLGATIGSSVPLGGREGLSIPPGFSVGGPEFERTMLPWTLGTLLAITLTLRLVLNSAAGAAIDRLRENPDSAERWFPVRSFRVIVVGGCVALATWVGVLYLAYQGRVSPSMFSLDFALLVLAFTVMAYRTPELAGVAALLYWMLPYWLTRHFPLSHQGAADLIRICWGALLIAAVVVPRTLDARKRLKGATSE